MTPDLNAQVEQALGVGVADHAPLSGGCIGEVYHARLTDGRVVVIKWDTDGGATLDIEGYMLSYLDEHSNLPVPTVHHSSPGLLIMDYVEGGSSFSSGAERHAAELLAELHGIRGSAFGLERDTLIGGLHQPNPGTKAWIPFFREHRLQYMAEEGARAGRLPKTVQQRVNAFSEQLDEFIDEPEHPALLHGDVWTTNVLAKGDAITAFLDPAVYYGHPEIELAFITLFHTFGQTFFDHYHERRPIAPGFFEQRRDIYNLYPLLVHVRLFGGGYVGSVEGILSKLGF